MNKNLNLAINLTQKLQKVIMRMAEEEKDLAAEKSSTDYPAKTIKDFFKENAQGDTVSATRLLDMVNNMLYNLLDYERDEGWQDEDEYEERSQLRLKEAIKK